MERGRPTARARRAKQRIVKSLKRTNSAIEELMDKRGWGSENKVFDILRQQIKNEEIIEFYKSRRYDKFDKRRYGKLDVRNIDYVVLVASMDLKNLENKFKNVPKKAKEIIHRMWIKDLSELAGYRKLVKLSRSGVFRVVTLNVTSSNGTKFHKQQRDLKKGGKNQQPVLVKESGEIGSLTLEKLRKLEGII